MNLKMFLCFLNVSKLFLFVTDKVSNIYRSEMFTKMKLLIFIILKIFLVFF